MEKDASDRNFGLGGRTADPGEKVPRALPSARSGRGRVCSASPREGRARLGSPRRPGPLRDLEASGRQTSARLRPARGCGSPAGPGRRPGASAARRPVRTPGGGHRSREDWRAAAQAPGVDSKGPGARRGHGSGPRVTEAKGPSRGSGRASARGTPRRAVGGEERGGWGSGDQGLRGHARPGPAHPGLRAARPRPARRGPLLT